MTIDANIVIAYLAGDAHVVETLSSWKEQGVSLFLPTVAIAATALFTHTPVVTRNQRDFKRVSNLRIVSL